MLASVAVEPQLRRLVPPGGLFDEHLPVLDCPDESSLIEALRWANSAGRRVTLMGSGRSFGHQFHPSDGGVVLHISRLDREARIVETNDDGTVWVRAGGGTRFCDLKGWFPGYRCLYPPTSDTVTLAGAIAACTHNTNGYFADDMRAFRLITAQGDSIACAADAEGLANELFWAVPGAFGALGVTTDIEIRMHPIAERQMFAVHSIYSGPSTDGRYLDLLCDARDNPRFAEGAGAVVYGNRGHAIVLADERLPLDHEPNDKQALLTDDDVEGHAFTQGLANRFPRIAEAAVSRAYPQGIMRWAPWYGFHFFHRGFDQSFEVLGRKGIKYALARAAGVDRRLPVYHQSWFYPRAAQKDFVELYFSILDEFPGIEKRVEQQDLVLLPPCRWPAHSIGTFDAPVGIVTSSYSVAALGQSECARIAEFFSMVSRESHRKIDHCRVSLCKQIHCDPSVLREMHAPWAALVATLKSQVDPDGLLRSRHLDALLE
jgi:FAD/FMN-containing dehydrogenase